MSNMLAESRSFGFTWSWESKVQREVFGPNGVLERKRIAKGRSNFLDCAAASVVAQFRW